MILLHILSIAGGIAGSIYTAHPDVAIAAAGAVNALLPSPVSGSDAAGK